MCGRGLKTSTPTHTHTHTHSLTGTHDVRALEHELDGALVHLLVWQDKGVCVEEKGGWDVQEKKAKKQKKKKKKTKNTTTTNKEVMICLQRCGTMEVLMRMRKKKRFVCTDAAGWRGVCKKEIRNKCARKEGQKKKLIAKQMRQDWEVWMSCKDEMCGWELWIRKGQKKMIHL